MLDIENFSYEISKYSKFKKFSVDYKILEQIGKGHFSIVLKAKNLIDNKIYAVKVLDIETLFENEEENIPLIMWEKTIFDYIKCVPSKYLIKPIEYYETSNNIYFVYEYLPNGKLSEYNTKNLLEVSKGLLYLKKNNIIHRDIKLDNILLDSNNMPKIIDFGLSKIQRPLDRAKEYYGSLSYMAPEIFEGKGYSNEVDVWSFGIMMHYLKYKNFPFDDVNDDNDVIRNNILNKDYNVDSDSKEDFIIKKCLEKNENERINIKELIKELNEIS
jgi:serine/threonine protein kinase